MSPSLIVKLIARPVRCPRCDGLVQPDNVLLDRVAVEEARDEHVLGLAEAVDAAGRLHLGSLSLGAYSNVYSVPAFFVLWYMSSACDSVKARSWPENL